MGRVFLFERGGVKVLLKISSDIKRLNKNFDSIDVLELKTALIEIENKILKTINSKGFFPTKNLVKDLLDQIRKLLSNLENYDKSEKTRRLNNMEDQIGEIIDQQMFSEIGGAGQYLKNLREAAEKKNK